ncbi:MAG: caspase family protein [Chloroflexota bacterium]
MTVYAMLVGINEYAARRVSNLSGCIADVEEMKSFLQTRVKPEALAEPLVLFNQEATRQGIIDGFENYLSQVEDGDVAFFYYSGHGTEEPAPEVFWGVEPNRKNGALVCHDSYNTDSDPLVWGLADKELAYLIEKISEGKDIHTLVIFDSCHSGSGTRDIEEEEDVRMTLGANSERPLETFLIQQPPAGSDVKQSWYTPPHGKHILMAACRPEQLAREKRLGKGDGARKQGVFSYYIREALKTSNPNMTYRDLVTHVRAMVRLTVNEQTPQLETQDVNLDQRFLGGDVIQPRPRTYGVYYDNDQEGFVIDGGTIHGIAPVVDENDTTQLVIFAKDDTTLELTNALGVTAVIETLATESIVDEALTPHPAAKGQSLASLSQSDTYKALVISSPLPRVIVRLDGDEDRLGAIEKAINETYETQAPSAFIRVAKTVEEADQAELRLTAVAEEEVYRIRRAQDSMSLFVDTPYDEEMAADVAVQQLEQMARWMKIYELNNPDTELNADAVTMTITRVDPNKKEEKLDDISEVELFYKTYRRKLQAPKMKVTLHNNTEDTLYAALVNLQSSYAITPLAPRGMSSTIELPPNADVELFDGRAMTVSIPDNLPDTVTTNHDLMKMIVSTVEFNAANLAEKKLPVQYREENTKNFDLRGSMDSLTALLNRIPNRDISFDDDVEVYSDWRTTAVSITTIRPQGEVAVSDTRTSVSLGEDITLINDAGITATARMMTTPDSARDLGSLGVPTMLQHSAGGSAQPFSFAATRSNEPGLSVLDLGKVENGDKVTAETPLKLRTPVSLADDEQVLAYGFDGEFYLPVGHVSARGEEGTEITLHRLPDPDTSEGSRSLTNSLRIYFHKLVSDVTGWEYTYPKLAVVEPKGGHLENPDAPSQDDFEYTYDEDVVRQRVAEADRILLYIHGITGETKGAVRSAWTGAPGEQIVDNYDVVLAFDYENLATGISTVANDLRQKLIGIGLGANHGKTLHIFAHSMGGLVSRWFVEQLEGGNEIVQHLVLFGTPSGGSPWANIQDRAFKLLTLGLNALTPVAWPVSIITGLLTVIESQDKMLDEMAVGSDLLKSLKHGGDPKIPYTIFAGNTSVIEPNQPEGEDSGRQALLKRLLQKLDLYSVSGLAFYNDPNDVAVSVESIMDVSEHRVHVPVKHEVACDHMSYFVPNGGWNKIRPLLPSPFEKQA